MRSDGADRRNWRKFPTKQLTRELKSFRAAAIGGPSSREQPPNVSTRATSAHGFAALLPDTLYLRGKRVPRREPVRPEISLCRECLLDTIVGELERFTGRVVAFEPNPEIFTQYFFVATPDSEAAGLAPETASAIEQRLAQTDETCVECSLPATWLWMPQEQVASLDETDKIRGERGEWFCSAHGARKLADAFERIAEANMFYMNLPYGEAGAYLWI